MIEEATNLLAQAFAEGMPGGIGIHAPGGRFFPTIQAMTTLMKGIAGRTWVVGDSNLDSRSPMSRYLPEALYIEKPKDILMANPKMELVAGSAMTFDFAHHYIEEMVPPLMILATTIEPDNMSWITKYDCRVLYILREVPPAGSPEKAFVGPVLTDS